MEMMETALPFPQAPARPAVQGGKRNANRYVNCGGVNSRLPNALFNDRDPNYVLHVEKPQHRLVTSLIGQGYTVGETAAATGFSTRHVSAIVRQPYARQRLIESMEKDVSQEIKSFLEGEVLENLRVMKAIRDDPKVRPETRLLAADKLTDRQMGRPTQPFTLPAGGKKPTEMTEDELNDAIKSAGLASTAVAVGGKAPQGD